SILFSDIRGFTSISEKLSPEALVSLLNRYLGPMTDIVLKNYGTLDKYIGDAVMAIYGAPITLEDHSVAACMTAIEMINSLPELNNMFKSEGLPEIAIGIGINTGDAIAGNMGTEVRFDYTVIGDTVNLASRLEGMTKMYKCQIIVSGATRLHVEGFCIKLPQHGLKAESTGHEFNFRELDLIKVKGKNEPVTMYELSLMLDRSSIVKFEEGLKLYRTQRFVEAKEIFQDLYKDKGDLTSSVYIKRCEEFISNPPPADWDGVYVATSK
ncbi:MAG: adenylate/guanylate cyclase domain-containing protein, partial [Nitrospirae bacterium]|nr:adenylate/guanylate cyclase domain-containing protein [Nitrospirota bacterium]